ncbi:hypothetical protein [Tautonia marina]|uniref:hypothetical protein n=1 Tax=Tautonia marina TaxID=2653855 RepID=UPI0012607BE1|nr:hypothetical protein [Tautonia marina]
MSTHHDHNASQDHPRPGPRTEEGKAASSANATTHGLTAKRPLSEEEAERLRVIVDQWTVKAMPETPPEEALIASAAIEYVRYLRCVEAEESRLGPAIRDAVRDWREAQRHAIRRKAQNLPNDPEQVAAELLESAFGIDWMLRHWRNLLAQIDRGAGWTGDNLIQAMHLLGHKAAAPTDPTSLAASLWQYALTAFPKAWNLSAPPIGDPEAVARIRASVLDTIAHLETLRPVVWDEVDAPRERAVEAAALIDTSKEGQQRHRYRRDASRDFHRSLAALTRLRSERSKTNARESKLMESAASRRVETPAYVPPTSRPEPPAPESRNEPPPTADSSASDRRNPFSEHGMPHDAPAPASLPERRTHGRTEGRTHERTEAVRTAPDAPAGLSNRPTTPRTTTGRSHPEGPAHGNPPRPGSEPGEAGSTEVNSSTR